MKSSLVVFSKDSLEKIHGGGNFTPYNGFGGGTYTTDGGSSFSVNPYRMSVGLSNQATNNLTSTLNTLGALAMQNPGLAASSTALGSILSFYNQGNRITITQPTCLPFPYGMHASTRR